MHYVLDTNVLVHLLRGKFGVAERIAQVGWDCCCISDMSVVELLYGAEVSAQREKNLCEVESLISDLEIIPLSVCIREFCQQKAHLQRIGQLIEDYDLFHRLNRHRDGLHARHRECLAYGATRRNQD